LSCSRKSSSRGITDRSIPESLRGPRGGDEEVLVFEVVEVVVVLVLEEVVEPAMLEEGNDIVGGALARISAGHFSQLLLSTLIMSEKWHISLF
jgi:hypothetical protein